MPCIAPQKPSFDFCIAATEVVLVDANPVSVKGVKRDIFPVIETASTRQGVDSSSDGAAAGGASDADSVGGRSVDSSRREIAVDGSQVPDLQFTSRQCAVEGDVDLIRQLVATIFSRRHTEICSLANLSLEQYCSTHGGFPEALGKLPKSDQSQIFVQHVKTVQVLVRASIVPNCGGKVGQRWNKFANSLTPAAEGCGRAPKKMGRSGRASK